jgi:polysaccharide pyruvyl transferase WcaK-like protein/peptidoglycan/xylan/chitin deacetylase (PgdA/CDA1 family)
VCTGAQQAIVIAPFPVRIDGYPRIIATGERDDAPEAPEETRRALTQALGTEAFGHTLVVYLGCFDASADPASLAEEVAEVAGACCAVAVIEPGEAAGGAFLHLGRAGLAVGRVDSLSDAPQLRLLLPNAPATDESARMPAAPLVVLGYHRVLPEVGDDPYRLALGSATFAEHLDALSAGFRVISVDEIADPDLGDGRPRVLITFDDGYRDNYEHAFPLLARRRLPAVVFAATGYVDRHRPFWWEAVQASPAFRALPAPARNELQERLRYMDPASREVSLRDLVGDAVDDAGAAALVADWNALAEMQEGGLVAVGAHTRWHSSLGRLGPAELREEVLGSLDDVEAALGLRPRVFAFPHGSPGDITPDAVAALAELGVDWAFTTSPGCVVDASALAPGTPAALTLPRLMATAVPGAELVRQVEALLPANVLRAPVRRRIAVLSGITANNLGDDAMLVSAVRDLRRLDPEAEIVVLAEDPSVCEPVAAQIGVPILPSLQLAVQRYLALLPPHEEPATAVRSLARDLAENRDAILAGADVPGLLPGEMSGLRALMGADGVMDCGGANLSPHWQSYLYEKCIDYLVAARPLFVSGQGVDRVDRPEDRDLLVSALDGATEITLREHISEDYLQEISCRAPLRTTGDDTVSLAPSTAERRDALLAAAGHDPARPYLAMQYRHYLDYANDRFYELMAGHVAAAAGATGLPVVGVPMHFAGTDEREHLRGVRDRLPGDVRFHVVEEHIIPADAKAVFAAARAAFGISYHSAVFSLTSGTPFLGLFRGEHYRQKMRGLERLYGLDGLAVPIETAPEAFGTFVADAVAARDELSAHLTARGAEIAAAVEASRNRFLAAIPAATSSGDAPPPAPGTVSWGDLRRLSPISRQWGFDRGRPVDRFYIERFLAENAHLVRGHACELLNDDYARRYGAAELIDVTILDIDPGNPHATLLADLTDAAQVPEGRFDAFILTQVLPYIHDCGGALANVYRSLRPGGTLLVTAPSVIKYHREPEDHWRFTPDSLSRLVEVRCPGARAEVRGHGNVLTACAFLMGLSCEELATHELEHDDPEFPIVVTARITRPA